MLRHPQALGARAVCSDIGEVFHRNLDGQLWKVTVERPREDWTYRIIKVHSPNGTEVLLEEQAPPAPG